MRMEVENSNGLVKWTLRGSLTIFNVLNAFCVKSLGIMSTELSTRVSTVLPWCYLTRLCHSFLLLHTQVHSGFSLSELKYLNILGRTGQ